MLNDVITTIKAQLYDRAVSPLFGAFALSWVGWNYRFIAVLLYSIPINEKFDFIDKVLFPDFWTIVTRGIIYPLLTTAFIIYVYPWPAKKVFEYWRNRQKELNEIRQKIEDETPLTKEEARQIRHEVRLARDEFDREIVARDTEIKRLKEESRARLTPQSKVTEIEPPRKAGRSKSLPSDGVNSNERKLLDLMFKHGGEIGWDEIREFDRKAPSDLVSREYDLEELERKKLISAGPIGKGSASGYRLTQTGREFLLKARPQKKK